MDRRFDDTSNTCNVCHRSFNTMDITSADPIEMNWTNMCHAVFGGKASWNRARPGTWLQMLLCEVQWQPCLLVLKGMVRFTI